MSSVVKPKSFEVKTTLDIVPQQTSFVDVIDTGTTTNCFMKESNVEKNRNVDVGINVMYPNGEVTQSIATAKVKLSQVFKTARDAHIFLSLASGSLNSVGQICDNGCTTYFNKTFSPSLRKANQRLVECAPPTANYGLLTTVNLQTPCIMTQPK